MSVSPNAAAAPKKNSFSFLKDSPVWFSLFSILLVLMPLPFGSNRPWSADLFAVLTGLCLALMLWQKRDNFKPSKEESRPPYRRLWYAAIILAVVALWSLIQTVSWTPQSWHHPIWQEASTLLGALGGSISVDPAAMSESLLHLLAYAGCFLIALYAGRDAKLAFGLVKLLAFAGCAYALYGLLAQSMGSTMILWYKKWAYEGFLTSTFVNKNSYAAYAGVGLLCTLAYLWQTYKDFQPTDRTLALKSKKMAILAALGLKDYARLMMPVVFLAALALTGSRGGVASTLLGLISFVIAMAVHHRARFKKGLLIAAVCFVLLLFFVVLGGQSLLVRLDEGALDTDFGLRFSGYKLTLQAIADNPWLGYGLGTFNSAFRLYRDASLPLWFHHAHNDYLEMIMDLGLPVALLLFDAIFGLISCCVQGLWVRKRRGLYPALAVGVTVLLGFHALMDFSFHIPAISATYAALLGLGVAQSWSSRSKEKTT